MSAKAVFESLSPSRAEASIPLFVGISELVVLDHTRRFRTEGILSGLGKCISRQGSSLASLRYYNMAAYATLENS